MYNKYIYILTFFLLLSTYSQQKSLSYKNRLTISDGLAHNGVSSVLEDSRGFIWFGTFGGLNKYDGYSLKTFKKKIDDKLITSNRIRSLAEDKKGNIWIGTDDGITLYNYKKQTFKWLYSYKLNKTNPTGPSVKNILVSNNGQYILCSTNKKGILIFDNKYNLLGNYYPDDFKTKKKFVFFSALQQNKNEFIFCTNSGLYTFDLKSKKFNKILRGKISYSHSIIRAEKNNFLVSLKEGLVKIKRNKKGVYIIKKTFFENISFRTLFLDQNKTLWLGTLNNGIVQVDYSQGGIDENKQYYFDNDLSFLRISDIITDKNKHCWVTTYNRGVYQFSLDKELFKSFKVNKQNSYGIKAQNINFIQRHTNNQVFLTTPQGEIGLFDVNNEEFVPIKNKILSNPDYNINSIYKDRKGNIWFTTDELLNIYRINVDNNKLENLSFKSSENTLRNLGLIRSYTEDDYGNIWIGTNSGVYRVCVSKTNSLSKIESLSSHPFFKNQTINQARKVYADNYKNCIWLGIGARGLIKVLNKRNTPIQQLEIKQYRVDDKNKNSISNNFISSVVRTPDHHLWIGTEGGGICKMINEDSDPKFIVITEKQGLSNDVVKNILYDGDGNLWISTNIGLNFLNTKNLEIRKFSTSDGLPFEDFWFAASTVSNGNLLFSSLSGLCFFDPNKVEKKESIPNLIIENLKINNRLIKVGDKINKRVVLKRNVSQLEDLNLKYNENVFSLDLKSIHYTNPKNHLLKYKLIPINKDWITVASDEYKVDFNGLQPGKYTLKAKVSNSLNNWSKKSTLQINIAPPFWKTYYAYIIYTLILLTIIYIVFRTLIKIQRLKYEVDIEQINTNNLKKVNEEKLRFFTDISHEIKTPLTLISGPVNSMLEYYKGNIDIKNKLELIKRQSKKIHQLIEQVQDFRKADANLLKMSYERFNFNVFIHNLVQDFYFSAESEQKSINIFNADNSIYVSADTDKLEKIFNNLINNAIKYTDNKDVIDIAYKADDKNLTVTIKDTGKGIDSVDLEHVFERFYQSHTKKSVHSKGSGIGLAFSKKLVEMHYGYISIDSEVNVGTTVTVKLPIVKELSEIEKLEELKEFLPKEEAKFHESSIITNNSFDVKVNSEFSDSVIFYAEDNTEMRNFVNSHLSKYFKIKCFKNGLECLNAMEQDWPDIVVSDVQMPELSGVDLCVKIKSDLKTSHIPIVLVTALTNIQDHLKGIKGGADAYIKKPFDFNELVTTIEALLINRKKLRERFQLGIPLTKEDGNSSNDNAFLEKLYSLFEENLDNQNLNLDHLAKQLYLNRTHFYQKVKELTNQTPFEILKNYRLKKAGDLLVQKKLPVSVVCSMTGFKDRTHFTKVFKIKYGVSPSKYVQSLNTDKND